MSFRVFTGLSKNAVKIGGRIPRGWSYYSDGQGITFNPPSSGITAKGRYVSLWRSAPQCFTVDGGSIYIPGRPSYKYNVCTGKKIEERFSEKLCINPRIQIRCSRDNQWGCHGGIAASFMRYTGQFALGNSLIRPSCCQQTNGGGFDCSNCTSLDWQNWGEEQKCKPKGTELCIYYDCCGHRCDRAIFEAVAITPSIWLGQNADGSRRFSEAKEVVFLTANLNNAEDGGPRGPFCAEIPAGTILEREKVRIKWVTSCVQRIIEGTSGETIELPDRSYCTQTEFSIVLDVKDSGETLDANAEAGYDSVPEGQAFFATFADILPNPTSFGDALFKMYGGASIRRANWPSTWYLQNNDGFFKLVGGASLPTAEDIAAGNWNIFGGSGAENPCKILQTYGESKIEFGPEALDLSTDKQVGEGDEFEQVLGPSAGHNGRKLDGVKNRLGFNFSHIFPPSEKTRRIYSHLMCEKIIGHRLVVLLAEEWEKTAFFGEPEEMPSKALFLFGNYSWTNTVEGQNDFSSDFNRDTKYNGSFASPYPATDRGVYSNIWHSPWNNFVLKTLPLYSAKNMNSQLPITLQSANWNEYNFESNQRIMPFKRVLPIDNVEMVKIYIEIPARAKPTKMTFMASSYIDSNPIA